MILDRKGPVRRSGAGDGSRNRRPNRSLQNAIDYFSCRTAGEFELADNRAISANSFFASST